MFTWTVHVLWHSNQSTTRNTSTCVLEILQKVIVLHCSPTIGERVTTREDNFHKQFWGVKLQIHNRTHKGQKQVTWKLHQNSKGEFLFWLFWVNQHMELFYKNKIMTIAGEDIFI